ncbi:hypothetical protein [Sphingomonas aerophila]|uniref:Cytochrome C oxidase assembly protein n=1 Tax=Sphingomonas aerophila TaxID=1344948 RepID=A0A7W9BFN1_9SPHN|nr:hypothetical protein [Sphingomonas aerophila]MBB5716350.1 hypothetical protein [Sphingomonas aerophila]
MTPDDRDLIRRRQRGRAIVMGLLLGALVVLVFAITIAKIRTGMA